MNRLLCLDIEATGPDPANDRIVELHIQDVHDSEACHTWLINPDRPIPAKVADLIGITDDMVAEAPRFEDVAQQIHAALHRADLLGFNLTNFDVPILWEELYRAGHDWDVTGACILDAGTLFKLREPRTLSAAVRFYCGREHDDAHRAKSDVDATIAVWRAQVERYALPDDRDALQKASNYDEQRLDLAGKLIVGHDGRPTYNFGKVKGVAVEDDAGFAQWMLGKDFSQNTKHTLRKILAALDTDQPRLFVW